MKAIVVDLGATSAKIHIVNFNGSKLKIEEIGRFRTWGQLLPTRNGSALVWNLPHFLERIEETIEGLKGISSISFSSWGVDYALFDEKGRLVSLPYHYRDPRTRGVMDEVLKLINPRELYERTGTQFMSINTLYQLYSMVRENDPHLEITDVFLMIANVFTYWFSGEYVAERTLASTTQMLNINRGKWDFEQIEKLEIPESIFPPLVSSDEILKG